MGNWIKSDLHLEGNIIKLVPLNLTHKEGLLKAASDGKLWELWFTSVPSESTIDKYLAKALDDKQKGVGHPFTVVDQQSGEIVGSTRFCDVQAVNRRVEIGYTWYAKKYQRTGVNTECKFLLLQYAFEQLDCIAVQFLTNWFNLPSRQAIARLGAKQDGVLRNHRLNPDGSCRDTVVFSITNQEWAGAKKSLEYKMEKYRN